MKVTHFEMSKILRDELRVILQGPGVTWNLNGILNAYDRATAATAFRVGAMELQKETTT